MMKRPEPMSPDQHLELLTKIKRTSPSPFLFTRIEGRLETGVSQTTGRPLTVAAFAALLIVILINIAAVLPSLKQMGSDSAPSTNDTYLTGFTNTLYHE